MISFFKFGTAIDFINLNRFWSFKNKKNKKNAVKRDVRTALERIWCLVICYLPYLKPDFYIHRYIFLTPSLKFHNLSHKSIHT